ncbi:MAG: DeoR/GlpR family DNA-binding transcription regulator [Oscillospiraceae bacterium]|nr:DeoR/GlpR family DNA-binding transcription regulator [Oscillospiraceae bacterium]
MNTARRETIKTLLNAKPFVSLHELEEMFPHVSSMTLRRDIEYFEVQGEAIKVRGGARSMKFITTSMEDAFNQRLHENIPAKDRIAEQAIKYIETGRSIFIDSGTTMMRLAVVIPDERLTITTTGPNIAIELLKKNQPIVNIVGGMLNRDNISVSGNQALRFLNDFNIDVAFITPSGTSLHNGLTSGNYTECELKKMVIEKARKVVVLMDASKLDKILPYTFCNLADIDIIITDKDLPEDITNEAIANDVEIIIA